MSLGTWHEKHARRHGQLLWPQGQIQSVSFPGMLAGFVSVVACGGESLLCSPTGHHVIVVTSLRHVQRVLLKLWGSVVQAGVAHRRAALQMRAGRTRAGGPERLVAAGGRAV